MKTKSLVLAFLLLGLPALGWGHGGEHHAPAVDSTPRETLPPLPPVESSQDSSSFYMEEDTPAGESTYGMEEDHSMHNMENPDEADLSLSGSSLLGGDPGLTPDPVMPAEGSHSKHDMSKMPEVIPSEHSRVSTSQKGYGVAAAITGISGLFFVLMSIVRPFE